MFNFLKKKSDMYLLVGLGNPGNEYKKNRHNIGFMTVDALASDNHFPAFKSKFNGEYSEGRIADRKVMLLKPQTYMNESGKSVGKVANFYKIPPEKIIVFYDELDIPFKRVKVKQGGGAGGHNGIKSIDAHLGDKDYWRVRMGIDHPGDKSRVSGYVLSDFSKAEQAELDNFIYAVVKYCDLLVDGNQNDFITHVTEYLK